MRLFPVVYLTGLPARQCLQSWVCSSGPMTSVIAARARNRPVFVTDGTGVVLLMLAILSTGKMDLSPLPVHPAKQWLDGCFAKGSVLMGLRLRGVSQSSKARAEASS